MTVVDSENSGSNSKNVNVALTERTHPNLPGMISEVKNLYEGDPDRRGRSTWTEKYPTDLDEPAENAESAHYALLIRNKKCYDGRKKLEIDSIVIQSPLLKDVLGVVLKNYPGITTSLDRLTFSQPFQPFVHRWGALLEAIANEQNPETKSHLDLLYDTLGAELKDTLKARDDFVEHKVITFDNVWMIFEPGCIVYAADEGHDCAVRLANGSMARNQTGNAYQLNCEAVDWNGENFGLASKTYQVSAFQGTKAITRLPAYPLSYHPSKDMIEEHLVERGRVFERYQGYHYKFYNGIAIGEGFTGPVKYNVNSRVIIDTFAWNRFNPNRQVSLNPLNKELLDVTSGTNSDCDDDDYDEYDDGTSVPGVFVPKDPLQQVEPLSKDERMLCLPSVRGYSLKNKKWLTLFVENVVNIKWSEAAFSSLQLPGDQKELVLALAESQLKNKETFDDVIHGKGKGMIMLLSGPPGVGKTLTAESVAENMRSPLYTMSAGDLGLDSCDIESSLSNVLEMCTKWKAVLLLDEADVFLEKRSPHDLERNKIVSIFLRMLEYYEGILFLTTNRVKEMDDAFQSRIHLSMAYEDLSPTSRRHVWSNFLASSSLAHEFSDADLDTVATYDKNGRQIKNVLKTAQLLASRKGVPLRIEHVETVLAVEKSTVIATGSE